MRPHKDTKTNHDSEFESNNRSLHDIAADGDIICSSCLCFALLLQTAGCRPDAKLCAAGDECRGRLTWLLVIARNLCCHMYIIKDEGHITCG